MCKQARWTIQRDRCKFEAVVSNRIVTRTSTASTTLDKYLRRGPSGISGVSAVAVESFDTLIGAFTLVLLVYRSADCMRRFDFPSSHLYPLKRHNISFLSYYVAVLIYPTVAKLFSFNYIIRDTSRRSNRSDSYPLSRVNY